MGGCSFDFLIRSFGNRAEILPPRGCFAIASLRLTNRKYFINAAIQNDLPSFVIAKPADRAEAIPVHC